MNKKRTMYIVFTLYGILAVVALIVLPLLAGRMGIW